MSRISASNAWHVRAVYFLSVMFLMCNSAFAQDKKGSGDKIKDLKEKRLVLLVKIDESYSKDLMAGKPTAFEKVRQAKVDLLDARLDLAATKEDRIKVCEEAIKDAEALEEIQVARWKVGSPDISSGDVLKAQVYVLEIRIALEKAKAAK